MPLNQKAQEEIARNGKIFSRQESINEGLQKKIARAKLLARLKTNPDFNIQHAGWCTDAQADPPNYTKLEADIIKEHNKAQAELEQRRLKNGTRI